MLETIIGLISIVAVLVYIMCAIGHFFLPPYEPNLAYFLAGLSLATSLGLSGFVVMTGALSNYGENIVFDATMGGTIVLLRILVIVLSFVGIYQISQRRNKVIRRIDGKSHTNS